MELKSCPWHQRHIQGCHACQIASRPTPEPQAEAVAWYVFADSEHWVTMDEDEAANNREQGFQVRPLIYGDTRPQPGEGGGEELAMLRALRTDLSYEAPQWLPALDFAISRLSKGGQGG